MRARRLLGMPLSEKTVIGIGHNFSVMAARITLKTINDELLPQWLCAVGGHSRILVIWSIRSIPTRLIELECRDLLRELDRQRR